jgi:hypothetical protein
MPAQRLRICDERKKMGRKRLPIEVEDLMALLASSLTLKQAAQHFSISYWTALARLKEKGIRINTKRVQDVSVFETYTPESCYWAGFLAADGCVKQYGLSMELGMVDRGHLEKFRAFLKSNADIRKRRKKSFNKISEFAAISIYCKYLADVLIDRFNIVPAKSLILEPPDLSNDMRRHFIRGLVDGDGSIGWHKYNRSLRISFGCGSEHVVEWVKAGIENGVPESGNPSISQRGDGNLFSVEFSGGKQAIAIGKWLYENIPEELYLERKKRLFDELVMRKRDLRLPRIREDEKLHDLYKQGFSYSDIAAHLGMTKSKVAYRLRRVPVEKRFSKNSGLKGKRIRKRDAEMLISYESGNKPEAIARQHGVALPTFWVAVRRARRQRAEA